MDLVNSGQIQREEANRLASILESHLFRLKVCKLNSNELSNIPVVGLCDLSKANGNLRLRLLHLLKANFLDYHKLVDSIMEEDIYHQMNRLSKLVLVILEGHRTKETMYLANAQVEHILPQRLNDKWRLQINNADKVKNSMGTRLLI